MLIYSILFFILLHSTALSVGVPETLFDQEYCTITKEMEEKCSAACYTSIKPLYNYVGTCQEKDKTLIELQDRVRSQGQKIKNLSTQATSLKTQKKELTNENSCAPHIIVEEAVQQVILMKDHFNSELNNLQVTVKDTEEVLAELLQDKLDLIKIIESLESQNKNESMECEEKIVQNESKLKQKEYTLNQEELSLKKREDSLKRKEESLQQKENSLSHKQKYDDYSNDIKRHTIHVSGIDPFEALYESNGAGSDWIVIQRRVNRDFSFNRSWSEYKKGFGSLQADYFIGLEKIYRLTRSNQQELYIELIQNVPKHAKFEHFRIGSERHGYRLKSIGNSSGDADDIVSMLLDQVGRKFSTYDRDYSCKLPEFHGDGWWYNNLPKSLLDFGSVKMMIRGKKD